MVGKYEMTLGDVIAMLQAEAEAHGENTVVRLHVGLDGVIRNTLVATVDGQTVIELNDTPKSR